MKKKILFFAFAAMALVACGDHNNDPIDESVLPKDEPTDIGCNINIPESGIKVLDMTYAEAETFLTAAGWTKDLKTSSKGTYFVCGDTALVSGPHAEPVSGPRSSLFLTVSDDKVISTSIETWCVPSEMPYQQLGTWDAWLHQELKTYEHWSAYISVIGGDMRNYSDFTAGSHQRFFADLPTLDDNTIIAMGIEYVARYNVIIKAHKSAELVQIKFNALK